jgi:hypothetical protein
MNAFEQVERKNNDFISYFNENELVMISGTLFGNAIFVKHCNYGQDH